MSKAHENIDNEIIANTLQEILHTKHGESMDILYKALTKENEDRYIHRNVPGYPTDERREWSGNMLRREIEQNPTFADTISYEKGMEALAPRESISSRILKALGIYDQGGMVKQFTEEFERPGSALSGLEYLGGTTMSEGVAKELAEMLSNRNYTINNITDIVSDIASAKKHKDKYEPGWDDISSVGNLRGIGKKMQPDRKKVKGLLGLLQRLLPGGKTGYEE